MVKIINEEIELSRDLKNLFPKEIINRQLFSKYIDYVMNHFFSKSDEERINGYIGKLTTKFSKEDYYISEPTVERQLHQLEPFVKSENPDGELLTEYNNFVNVLKTEGCNIVDNNKLLSDYYWSWCPPVNIDMFLNFSSYYWIRDGVPAFTLESETNFNLNILGEKNYTYNGLYNDNTEAKELPFMNGMRIIFKNDVNSELNDKVYIINGVGDFIEIISDEYISPLVTTTPDYYVMERGSVDGNEWSIGNRWFHRDVINLAGINSSSFTQAKLPILCYNKNIQLLNYGTYNRGYADLALDMNINELNGSTTIVYQNVSLQDEMILLLLGDNRDEIDVYKVTGIKQFNKVVLQKITNGKNADGISQLGEVIKIKEGTYKNKSFHYDNEWILSQSKESINQAPLFNLYNVNEISYTDKTVYLDSDFIGSKLFDYKTTTDSSATIDANIGKKIIANSTGDYIFTNDILNTIEYKNSDGVTFEDTGYKYFKNIKDNKLYNGWYKSSIKNSQFLITTKKYEKEPTFETISDVEYLIIKLAYTPSTLQMQENIFVTLNANQLNKNIDFFLVDNEIRIKKDTGISKGDCLTIKFYVEKIDTLVDGYVFELPLALTSNSKNEEFYEITMGECFNHVVSLIENQKDFEGKAFGVNNYFNIHNDFNIGTNIVQHYSPIIRTMILTTSDNTSYRSAINYESKSYVNFKNNFQKVLNNYYMTGKVLDNVVYTDSQKLAIIQEIIDSMNLGLLDFSPFFNNGVGEPLNNPRIPATPAYLGLSKLYQPIFTTLTDTVSNPQVILCHDGSIKLRTNDCRDDFNLYFETLIYNSVNSFVKDNSQTRNYYSIIPGYFRETEYTLEEYRALIAGELDKWAFNNNYNYYENTSFNKNDPFTWNYSTCFDINNNKLYGSYRSIYQYYYDTWTPNTTPWEMLGFSEMPDWWETYYGSAPYTSKNIPMWQDIENGIIKDGSFKGQYKQFMRIGLISNYLPVDANGNLKNPIEIGIVQTAPIALYAKNNWEAGDIGSVEYYWRKSSEFNFSSQIILYLMKPSYWVESSWNMLDNVTYFKNQSNEQIVNKETNLRSNLLDIYVHNELVNDSYVRKIGSQQWLSDFLMYNTLNITDYLGDVLRNMDINLGYRCSGYYQRDTVDLISDKYGKLSREDFSLHLYKSNTGNIYTYSAIKILKLETGYQIMGYDLVNPYFNVLIPNVNKKHRTININGKNIIVYSQWQDNVKKIPYNTIFNSIQELFTVIDGYGKYLETNLKWYFNFTNSNGEIEDFYKSAKDYVYWASSTNVGEILLLDPAYSGLGNQSKEFFDKMGQNLNGSWTLLNSNQKEIKNNQVSAYRKDDISYFMALDDAFAYIKLRTLTFENVILIKNVSTYDFVLYNNIKNISTPRLNLLGIKAKNWLGNLTANGYLITDNGVIPNYDKSVEDMDYTYDTFSTKSYGIINTKVKEIIGYKDKQYMENLLQLDDNKFDFYKGNLREKGIAKSFNKLQRSKYLYSGYNENDRILFEMFAFKVGVFGDSKDTQSIELNVLSDQITQNIQTISFTTNIEDATDGVKYDFIIDKTYLDKYGDTDYVNTATYYINNVKSVKSKVLTETTVNWKIVPNQEWNTKYDTVQGNKYVTSNVTIYPSPVLKSYLLTLNVNVDDAMVVINSVDLDGKETINTLSGTLIGGQLVFTKHFTYGSQLTITVSREGYADKVYNKTIVADETIDVELEINTYTYTFNITPSDATSVIKVNDIEQEGRVIEADYSSTISWNISKTDFITEIGEEIVRSDKTMNIVMKGSKLQFALIVTPTLGTSGYEGTSTALVSINGVQKTVILSQITVAGVQYLGCTFTATYGDNISWSVQSIRYKPKSGSFIILEDTTLQVKLERTYFAGDVIFESATTGTYNVELVTDGLYEVVVVGGGGGCAYERFILSGITRAAGGGSGGLTYLNNLQLNKGVYTITIGAAGANAKGIMQGAVAGAGGYSSFNTYVAEGGTGGSTYGPTAGVGGTGLTTNGNNGIVSNTPPQGGASVYYGVGAGGSTNAGATNGFVKVKFISEV